MAGPRRMFNLSAACFSILRGSLGSHLRMRVLGVKGRGSEASRPLKHIVLMC